MGINNAIFGKKEVGNWSIINVFDIATVLFYRKIQIDF